MKKSFLFLSVNLLLILQCAVAQPKISSLQFTIEWTGAIESRRTNGETLKVLSCKECSLWKNDNRLPFKTIFIEGQDVKGVKLENPIWLAIPGWELSGIDTGQSSKEHLISHQKSEKNRIPGTEIELSLIRKNGSVWEKLISGQISTQYETIFEKEKKVQQTLTEGNSVFNSGLWLKFGIVSNGVYQIQASDLSAMGLDLIGKPSAFIKMYGTGGKMLSEANRDFKFTDIPEVAILVEDGGDGIFNNSDRILFYGQGPDSWNFNSSTRLFSFQKNIYTDTSYYFLSFSPGDGKRIPVQNSDPNPEITETTYLEKWVYSPDNLNLLSAGREWFADALDFNPSKDISIQTPNLFTDSTIRISFGLMARTPIAYPFHLSVNGTELAPTVTTGTTDVNAPYANFGSYVNPMRNYTAPTGTSALHFNISYLKQGNFSSVGYIDDIEIQGYRSLSNGGNFGFRPFKYQDKTIAYQIGTGRVWDVTNPESVQAIFTSGGKFSRFEDVSHEYFVFQDNALPKPLVFKQISNQNLRGMQTPDLLIVSHPNFLNQANRLANFRRANDNLEVEVVSPDQIYNEFSSGSQDITAIRNFAMHLYYKSDTPKLKFLLLFGKGSFDYKNRVANNTNFVPTYESPEFNNIISSYASDDYFGILNRTKGIWRENDLMDIGVGRLPAKSEAEAMAMVDKIIHYATSPNCLGPWRDRYTFVADNRDGCLHSDQSNTLSGSQLSQELNSNIRKIFIGAYPQLVSPGGTSNPQAQTDLLTTIERGSLILNYTGHGGETVWADEYLLTSEMIEKLKNKDRLGFYITATCDFGRCDLPAQVSGAETFVLNPNGGAIGIMTTGRPVSASSNMTINEAFYNSLYQPTDGRIGYFGDIMKMTKNICGEKRANRGFTLLGDPSGRFPFPQQDVVLTNFSESDTIQGLELVEFNGEVQADGVKDAAFNGTLFATLFDKPGTITIDPNQTATSRVCSYPYQKNMLFNGSVPVKDGEFKVKFFVSRDVSYQVGNGRLIMYAEDKARNKDANGYKNNVKVGGLNPNPRLDDQGPVIQLYMNDYTFVNYGLVSPDATLWADLEDSSGIDVTGLGLGHDLTATLDGDEVFVMNENFQNFTGSYKKGFVRFPFRGLEPGIHSLTVKAWDNFNNSSEATIWFEVIASPSSGQIVGNFNLFPNPFSEEIFLTLDNALAGQNLDISLTISDLAGREIMTKNWLYNNSTARPGSSKELAWDGKRGNGEKLSAGTYICQITVKSDTNGSGAKINKKIVLIR
jgi:hypothetical protein